MPDFLFRGDVADLDPELAKLTSIEDERQVRKLILIPSESSAPAAVRGLLASSFQNIYAEGYPDEDTRWMSEDELLDYGMRLAHYRRYSDPRYYKGVEYVNVVESLARRRCAELFAANGISADEIFVNVQALSGGPANNAVYHALVAPGDTVMGLDLLHGGHLSHGSPVNRSGKYFNIVHYTVDAETEKINYDEVERLALEHRPKMIICGFSSYPWIPDFKRFRQIADRVGAYLLADISHIAGLVAAGVVASPLGIADVIMSTTHKSLCGPRGAVILTTSSQLARKIDRAVFPGEQGGPHINTMAAQATAFKLAATTQFRELQQQIIDNSRVLSETIAAAGFHIPFGGTESHLTNVDCRSVVGEDGTTLSGDMAARILDLAGIVVNRNTIPGDRSAANPSGIRIGTPWITQRGFKEEETRELGEIIAALLKACKPYAVAGKRGMLDRAKVDFQALNEARRAVRDLALSAGIDYEPPQHGSTHFQYLDDPAPQAPYAAIELRGEQAAPLLRWCTSSDPSAVAPGASVATSLSVDGKRLDSVLTREDSHWQLALASADAQLALTWLRDLSDGFVIVDAEDLARKLPGPVAVEFGVGLDQLPAAGPAYPAAEKPWFAGMPETDAEALPVFNWEEPEEILRRTALFETHKAMGAKMVPFAGWEMPVWYSSVIEEHLATRQAAGLFDVSHMGVYQVEGPEAVVFLDCVVANDVAGLAVGESLYTQFLDPDGAVIDDTMVYRRAEEVFLVVVNASNDDKDWAWLNAVREGRVRVDNQRPGAKAYGRACVLRNLRDPREGAEMRVDIALQGPKSREILLALGCDEQTTARLRGLPWAGVMEGRFGGLDLVVSRTGYTGERVAFELFVHPEKSVALWQALLQAGEPLGIKAVGLGARDSLRTEAGLPLYGHEMAGEAQLGVGAAGFASYVKTYKPWFIGRQAFLAQEAARQVENVRFRFDEKGVRMAHYDDPIVDRRGKVIGFVTSCAVDADGYLLGQASVERKYSLEGTGLGIFSGSPSAAGKAPAALRMGDKLAVPTAASVLSRFPRRK